MGSGLINRDPNVALSRAINVAAGNNGVRQVELSDLKVYRGVPAPKPTPMALNSSVEALKEMVEILTRQRGFVDDSMVTVGELQRLYNRVNSRLDILETATRYLLIAAAERGVLSDTTGLTINGATNVLESWDQWAVSSDTYSKLTGVPATGVITVAIAGSYKISGQLTYTGSGNNSDYTLGGSINGGASITIMTNSWSNQIAEQSFTWMFTPVTPFQVGDTVSFTMIAGGSFNTTNAQLFFEFLKPL